VHLTIRPPESDSQSESYPAPSRDPKKRQKSLDSNSYGSGMRTAQGTERGHKSECQIIAEPTFLQAAARPPPALTRRVPWGMTPTAHRDPEEDRLGSWFRGRKPLSPFVIPTRTRSAWSGPPVRSPIDRPEVAAPGSGAPNPMPVSPPHPIEATCQAHHYRRSPPSG